MIIMIFFDPSRHSPLSTSKPLSRACAGAGGSAKGDDVGSLASTARGSTIENFAYARFEWIGVAWGLYACNSRAEHNGAHGTTLRIHSPKHHGFFRAGPFRAQGPWNLRPRLCRGRSTGVGFRAYPKGSM